MTRWRVDFEIKSDFVLVKDQKQVVFRAPDKSHEIYLVTRRGPGKHAADELYLSSHVILGDDDPMEAADRASVYLRQFLQTLAIVTSAFYRVKRRVMVVDWTPGLTKRHVLYFKMFPNPNVPLYGLSQNLIDSVIKLSANPIPLDVRLAMSWWARGVASSDTEQFQYFWYALEILAGHLKPAIKVPSKCPFCGGDLYCQTCNKVPLHRPYPKQALKFLIEKHVRENSEHFFKTADEARNRLLHGEDDEIIERELGVSWEKLSDGLGKVTWAALLDTLSQITMKTPPEDANLDLTQANTFVHYDVTLTTDMTVGAHHANPDDPQIDEFQLPTFELNMVVNEHEKIDNKQA